MPANLVSTRKADTEVTTTPEHEQTPGQPAQPAAPQQPEQSQAQEQAAQPQLPAPTQPQSEAPQPYRYDAPQPTQAAQPAQPAQPVFTAPGVQQAPQAQPAHFTQPTVQLPDTAPQPFVAPQPAAQSLYQAADYAPQAEQPAGHEIPAAFQAPSVHAVPAQAEGQKKSRAGVFFAGIAVGAVVAGIVGGGAGALVAANLHPAAITQPQTNGRVTLNNLDSATDVSGVAVAATPSVVTLEVSGDQGAGSGSGVIYSEDGYIVTNAHVVTLDGAAGSDPEIRVWLSDGRILDGTLVGTDPFADLAVVKVEASDLVPIQLADSSKINVGDLAVAIGAPLNLSNTVTSGVVSALNRGIAVGSPIIPEQPSDEQDQPGDSGQAPWYRFDDPGSGQGGGQQPQAAATQVTLPVVQTDASINPGNSGGALLNKNAELIGINVAIASNGGDSSTAGSDGLGFAIPVNMVKRVADALIAGERPSHGKLGIGVNDSSADNDADRNVAGGLISELVKGGPAAAAGLKVGDVITAVDGIPADSGTSVSALVRMHEGGDEVTITYTRDGKPGEAKVTLGTLEW